MWICYQVTVPTAYGPCRFDVHAKRRAGIHAAIVAEIKRRRLTAPGEYIAVQGPSVPNVRFWTHGPAGDVRLTLRPGQELSTCYGGPHEEGYEWTAVGWSYDGCEVRRTCDREGRDCDGPWRAGGESTWRPGRDRGNGWPVWVVENTYQRDAYAEQMGY